MHKRIIKLLKVVAIVCVTILVIELVYIGYLLQGKSIYFDGINSVIGIENGYLTVGSNNNNDKYFEKAKITKYNLKKEKKFETLYNKGYNGAFFDVLEDANGNFVAVGSYEKNDEEHEKGIRTALIVSYDKDGNLLYENDFQVLGNSKFTSITLVDDGYIVTGQSVYEDMIAGMAEDGGAFVVKYDDKLKLKWKSNLGDCKTAIYNDAVVVDNYIYAVGKSDTSVGLISKYNLSGELIESKTYEYTDKLGFTGIINSNGYLYVCAAKKMEDSNNINAVILQYNTKLSLREEEIYEDDGYSRFNQITVDENNNFIVIGTTAGLDKDKSIDGVNVFVHDGLIGKYDKDLEKISVVIYGDDRDDYFTDVINSDGTYLVTGYSSYEDGSYLSKFITYSDALKILGVE